MHVIDGFVNIPAVPETTADIEYFWSIALLTVLIPIEYVAAFARIVLARIVSRINVNQAISVKMFVYALAAACETLAHTQSVKVPPA